MGLVIIVGVMVRAAMRERRGMKAQYKARGRSFYSSIVKLTGNSCSNGSSSISKYKEGEKFNY